MQNQASAAPKIILETPKRRRPLAKWLTILAGAGALSGVTWAWQNGLKPSMEYFASPLQLGLVEVDRGDILQLVIENGTLESASDATVKCKVEALIGLTGGANGANGTTGGRSGSGGGTGGQSGSGGAGGAAQTPKVAAPTTPKSARGASTSKSVRGASTSKSKTASAKSGSSSGSGGSTSTAASSSGSGSSSASASSTGTTASLKPVIRSFSYMVTPHTPLKPTTGSSASNAMTKNAGANGGGNRGGGRGNNGMQEEKPGSTRILSLLPEGTKVKKGQIVCELDASSFKDELAAQKIRHLQAKSWVEQAQAILEVNQITLREYRDGIYPQDVQLIRQYIQSCQIEYDISVRNQKWSKDMVQKGLRTRSQLIADDLSVQQTSIALSEAKGMLVRLEKFTGPKLMKSLEAKLASILTDKLAQDSSFALETERLHRLEKNIAACTLRAPDDGVVVYVHQTNGWGRVEAQIEQGVTVREEQPIFQLPDPRRLRVKARINETKVAQIQPGQRCEIVLDAFPERKLHGKVTDVTAIATPVNGPFSDVRVYFAMVSIEESFDDLRPGLSAEVVFLHDQRSQVERLPIGAVREVDGESFVAVPDRSRNAPKATPYRWQKVELGLSGADYVEVLSGVQLGDRVVADPFVLDPPDAAVESAPVVAAPVATLTP